MDDYDVVQPRGVALSASRTSSRIASDRGGIFGCDLRVRLSGSPAGNHMPDKIVDVSQVKVLWKLPIHCRDEIAERPIHRIDLLAIRVVAPTWLMARIFNEDLCKRFDELMRSSIRVPASPLLL
jgi:hypothetical protein